jgi:hypothetical protein
MFKFLNVSISFSYAEVYHNKHNHYESLYISVILHKTIQFVQITCVMIQYVSFGLSTAAVNKYLPKVWMSLKISTDLEYILISLAFYF